MSQKLTYHLQIPPNIKGKSWVPFGEYPRYIPPYIPPIYGLNSCCIGQCGVIFGEQLLGYTPKRTRTFPVTLLPQPKTNISFAKFIVGFDDLGVSKNRGTPKWMVKIIENPIKMDDLGVSLFSEKKHVFPFKMIPFLGRPSSFIDDDRQTPPGQPVRPPDVSDPRPVV